MPSPTRPSSRRRRRTPPRLPLLLQPLLLALALLLLLPPAALGDQQQGRLQHQRGEASVSPSGAIDDPYDDDDGPLLDEAAVRRLQHVVVEEMMTKQAAADPQRQQRANYYAACPLFDHLMNASWGCPFMRASRALQTTLCENVSSTTSAKLPLNPTGLLPVELTDLRPDLPFEVPKALIDHERPTYYWLYRYINNLYNYANHFDDEGEHVPKPPVPPGWSDQQLHIITHDNIRVWPETYMKTPMAMTMMHHERNTMVIIIRGTLARQEWAYDFQYNFATPESGATKEFPGRVHQGIYDAFVKLRDSLLAEVERFRPRHVFITGHSLGGALTHLTSYAIARKFPGTRVDGVAFASLLVGDEAFMKEVKAVANLRAVMYLGTGQDGRFDHIYRVGDMIPQFTCGSFHGCPSLNTGSKDDKYQYAMLGPYVPFYSEDMPNTDHWIYEESLMNPWYRFYATTHMCSYICWTAQGLDPETRCYFPRQYLAHPGKYNRKEICLVWSPLGQQVL